MQQAIHKNIKLLIAILVCGSTCFAQARPPAQRPTQTRPGAPFLQHAKVYEETPYVTKVVLRNGMTVLVDEFRVQPVVSLQAIVRAGHFDDPPQSPGLANLVGSLVQRGTPDRGSGNFRQKVQSMGGVSSHATDYAKTVFEIAVPSDQWKRALSVQAEAILNPSFDLESIKLEAVLAQNEARGILDNPRQFGNERLLQLAFSQSRMGKDSTVSTSGLEKTTPESLGAFYKSFYTPSRMLLVVSGDVSSSDILNEVVRLYTKPAGAAVKPAQSPLIAAQGEFRFSSLRGNVPVPHLFFGFHTVPENDEDSRALEVLGAILGLGHGSVLSSRLHEEKKLVLSVQSRMMLSPEFGYYSLLAECDAANIDRCELAILTEMELLKRDEPTETDLERALAQLERAYWEGQETVTGRAQTLARFELLGDWKRRDRRLAELRRIKGPDIRRAAAKYLRLQNCTLLEYLPANYEERALTQEAALNTFTGLLTLSADEEQAKRNKQSVPAVKPSLASSFKFSEIRYPFQTASILRGPSLFIREDHSSPLIEMGLFFPGGRLNESGENSGITRLMTGLMLRGGSDIAQFYRQLEVYGGQVRPVVADDYFGIYLSVLSQNFEGAFKLVLEAIREPAFDDDEVQRQADLQIADAISRRLSGEFALEVLKQSLFEGFPYSLGSLGTETSVAAIKPESLKAWYASHVKNRKPVIAIIGDTKGTSLASVFVQNFSGSRMQEGKLPEAFAKPIGKGKSVDRVWDRSESLILFGFQAPPEDDEDGYAAAVIQGYAGNQGRLAQEVRDRLGAAYQVSVTYEPRMRGGSLVVYAAASPGAEDSVVKSIREEIKRMVDGPIQYRDFRAALNQAMGEYALKQQVRAVQIEKIARAALSGKGIEGYQNYSSALVELREEDLNAIAGRILDLNKAVVVVVRGKK
jgi:zinc protease